MATDCVQGCDVDGVYSPQSTCDLTCQPGYQAASPTGSPHYTCHADGNWESSNPLDPYQCSGKPCDQNSLPKVSAGGLSIHPWAEINDNHYPSIVTFFCPGGQHPADKQHSDNDLTRWACDVGSLTYKALSSPDTKAADLQCSSGV